MSEQALTNINKNENSKQVTNTLFPVFLKLEELSVLIVGGGNVGLEKLQAVLNNSPATKIKLVAITIKEAIKELALAYPNLQLIERAFEPDDLRGVNIVITAINDPVASELIGKEAKRHGK